MVLCFYLLTCDLVIQFSDTLTVNVYLKKKIAFLIAGALASEKTPKVFIKKTQTDSVFFYDIKWVCKLLAEKQSLNKHYVLRILIHGYLK